MSDEKPKDTSNRDMAIRSSAIDMAIRALCAQDHNEDGMPIINPDKLICAARQIEQYIKNGLTQHLVIGAENSSISIIKETTDG